MGGIPGLANVSSAQEIKDLVYTQNPSLDNPDKVYPAGALHGARGRARPAAHVRHRQDARPDRRRRLLHARLPARGAPDRGRARRRHRRPQGRGRAAAQGGDHRRRAQVVLRRVRAGQGREEDHRLQAHLGVPPRSREVPARAGRHLHGSGDRAPAAARAAPASACRAAAATVRPRAWSTRAPRCSARWPRSSTRPTPRRSPAIAATVPDPLGTFYRFGLASSLLRRARV